MNILLKQHSDSVETIQKQVKTFYERKTKIKVYHGTSNSTRSTKFEKDKYIDISKLNQVISVNSVENFILVEPNVSMDKLVQETLKYGLIPPVVPEFPGITIGGAVQGGQKRVVLLSMEWFTIVV